MNNGASQPHPPVLPLRESSHIPIHEVKRKLHIGGLSSFLLWLSKTDYYVLSLCPTTTRNTLASLGMMVIFTTLLAFASSLYTLKTAVVPPDAALSWPISAVLAVVYAFGILIIDREIVGATSSRALFIRFFFAALIATAVSYPVKLLFFEGRIVNEIDQMLEEEHAPKLERIEHLRSTIDKERWEQREGVRSQIDAIDTDIKVLDEEIKREGDIVNCGTKCQALLAQKKEMMEERLGLVERLEDLAATGTLPKPILEEINALGAEMKARRDAAYDFLYKAAALDRIAEEVGASYQWLSWFILVFFFLLEIVPLGLKLALGKTEYHYYIEARTQINNQKIISWANLYIRWMQDHEDDQTALERVPIDVMDTIATVMEDESAALQQPRPIEESAAAPAPSGGEAPDRDPIETRTPREDPPATDGGGRNA